MKADASAFCAEAPGFRLVAFHEEGRELGRVVAPARAVRLLASGCARLAQRRRCSISGRTSVCHGVRRRAVRCGRIGTRSCSARRGGRRLPAGSARRLRDASGRPREVSTAIGSNRERRARRCRDERGNPARCRGAASRRRSARRIRLRSTARVETPEPPKSRVEPERRELGCRSHRGWCASGGGFRRSAGRSGRRCEGRGRCGSRRP